MTIDKFDYMEPGCPLCRGREFYYPDPEAPAGRIPVGRIIDRADAAFDKDAPDEAGRLYEYWRDEAVQLRDREGELSMESELVGYYRKIGDRERGLESVRRALVLAEQLGQLQYAAGATVLLNCATAYKAFGMPSDAMGLYARAEEIYRRTLPEGDAKYGGLYNNMALALCDMCRFDEAEASYGKALRIVEADPQRAPDAAITYVNMAHMYDDRAMSERYTDCMYTAYDLLTSHDTAHDGYFAYVCTKCAPSFEYFGFDRVGRKLRELAESIYRENRGE